EGTIIDMVPIGSGHAGHVTRLNRILVKGLGDLAVVSPQNPVRLSDLSEPQPDLAVLRPNATDYADRHPRPEDVLLLVEVSDATLEFDRTVKAPLYARAGIPELWIVDLQASRLLVHRSPSPTGYQEVTSAGPGEHVACLAFPGVALEVGDLV
ncbi:MAG TPA: Uma2 family endonuclease, partial [Actinomycetota bacterium]|nr:Uma2 family endonuclease [Actinomycetota bacterium]